MGVAIDKISVQHPTASLHDMRYSLLIYQWEYLTERLETSEGNTILVEWEQSRPIFSGIQTAASFDMVLLMSMASQQASTDSICCYYGVPTPLRMTKEAHERNTDFCINYLK